MGLHDVGVCEGRGQRRADAAGRANRPEEMGAFIALVGRLARLGSALGPSPDKAILLADAGLVLKPELDSLASGDVGEMGFQRRREVF